MLLHESLVARPKTGSPWVVAGNDVRERFAPSSKNRFPVCVWMRMEHDEREPDLFVRIDGGSSGCGTRGIFQVPTFSSFSGQSHWLLRWHHFFDYSPSQFTRFGHSLFVNCDLAGMNSFQNKFSNRSCSCKCRSCRINSKSWILISRRIPSRGRRFSRNARIFWRSWRRVKKSSRSFRTGCNCVWAVSLLRLRTPRRQWRRHRRQRQREQPGLSGAGLSSLSGCKKSRPWPSCGIAQTVVNFSRLPFQFPQQFQQPIQTGFQPPFVQPQPHGQFASSFASSFASDGNGFSSASSFSQPLFLTVAPPCQTQVGEEGRCRPLTQCVTFYADVPELRRQPCQLNEIEKGVCCPLKKRPPRK